MSFSWDATTWIVAVGTATFLTLKALFRWWRGHNASRYPYPPGPRGLPFVNNIFDLPIHRAWEGYVEFSKKYGDIMFFRAFNTPILVLGSLRRVEDLLEKRSTLYSGRPHSVMMHELLRFDNFFAVADYGPWWRKHRKAFHDHFHPTVLGRYHKVLEQHTHRLMADFSENRVLEEALRDAIAGMSVEIIYGARVEGAQDPFIRDSLIVADAFEAAGVPGRFLVENLPILKYIPTWVPGAGFQRWAEFHRLASRRVLDNPFETVLKAYKEFEAAPCVATGLIDQFSDDETQREEDSIIARNVCAQTHLAAVDTTHSTLMACFLAMVMHREVQRKAQDELDRVAGQNMLPHIGEISKFPYIHAMIKETIRWHQVLPLGLPHLVSEDHIYDGYFIPKGTLVFGNAWGIMHDPELFEQPMEFKPERYLKNGILDHGNAVEPLASFGYGRRMCPGQHLATDIMFSIISSTLAVYNILPPVDEQGNRVKVEAKFVGGALMQPAPFHCVFEPRCESAIGVISHPKSVAT